MAKAAEMDSFEVGLPDEDDCTGLEETTVSNSSASGGSTDRDKSAKSGERSWLGRLLLLYSDSLDRWPMVTKSVSSGLIGILGDIAAQAMEWSFGDGPAPWSDRYVIWRSFAVMIDGLFVNGPLLHYAYNRLETYMPAGESVLGAMMQVGVDVFVIDPIFAFIFVWSTGLVEGLSVENDILHTIRYNFLSMVMWLIILGLCWAPLQIYLFNRYPVQFRVLVADFIDLIWTLARQVLWPVVTKSASSGLIGALGDIVAQAMEWSFSHGQAPWSDRYVGVDVFVIDPIFAFIFVWSTGLVEGLSVENDILHTIRYNFLSMVIWLIILGLWWAPIQICLFNRYPVQFRVLVAVFIDLVWTFITSFFAHVHSR